MGYGHYNVDDVFTITHMDTSLDTSMSETIPAQLFKSIKEFRVKGASTVSQMN